MKIPEILDFDSVAELRSTLSSHCRLGIDTEFMRERTYFAQLCLLQVAAGDRIVCIDPLSGAASGDETWQLLMQHEWVLHSARQDIEVIYQAAGQMPRSIWDTQIAASLLGFPPQIGYAGLVAELFEVQLAKTHTRADWSRRPLTDGLLHYAAEDVQYLLPAAEQLAERLEALGRLTWAEEEAAALLDPALYATDAATASARLKGVQNLRGAAYNIALRLAEWRESEAVARNRPRQWILKDRNLLDIAQRNPQSTTALASVPELPDSLVQREGTRLLAAIRQGEEDTHRHQPPERPDEGERALLKAMKSRVATVATQLNIVAEVIAPRKDLSAAIRGDRAGRLFQGWRRQVIGEDLLQLLDGHG
jgi:ribonuclease D